MTDVRCPLGCVTFPRKDCNVLAPRHILPGPSPKKQIKEDVWAEMGSSAGNEDCVPKGIKSSEKTRVDYSNSFPTQHREKQCVTVTEERVRVVRDEQQQQQRQHL